MSNTCPKCGYCESCGRSNQTYPYYGPYIYHTYTNDPTITSYTNVPNWSESVTGDIAYSTQDSSQAQGGQTGSNGQSREKPRRETPGKEIQN